MFLGLNSIDFVLRVNKILISRAIYAEAQIKITNGEISEKITPIENIFQLKLTISPYWHW